MEYLPEKDCDIPNLDLLSLLFDSPFAWGNEDTILHAEAADESNHITKAQSRTITKRLAHVFRNRFGVGKSGPGKDVVICMSANQILVPNILFGVVAAGGIYSAASSSLTPFELARQIEGGGSQLIVTTKDTQTTAVAAARKCGIPPGRVLVLESMGHQRTLADTIAPGTNYLQETNELEWERITDRATLEQRPICLLYSSGTTGAPKGVELSHRNFVAEAVITRAVPQDYLNRVKPAGQKYEHRVLAHLPVAHVAGLQGYFVNPAMLGGTVFWMPKFDFSELINHTKRHRITYMTSVPPIYLLVAQSTLVTDHFRTLIHAQTGAAPMGPDMQRIVRQKLGCNLSQAWGLTETMGAATGMPWDQQDETGSLSPLLPNFRLRIVDDRLEDVEEGRQGEILIRGPAVTRGYFNNPEATALAFTPDGWFRTGDIGVRRNRMVYIVDRKKELIKYKGLQVAPAEIEAFLLGHDKIADVAIIGIEDPSSQGNEIPRAYVVPKRDDAENPVPISEDEVKDYVSVHMASHKKLRGGVGFVNEIPRNPSGKILRRELRDLAKSEERRKGAKL